MTPRQFAAPCYYCGLVIDVRRAGTFERVTGWAPRREGGGANTIAMPERLHEYACATCIEQLRKKIHPSQGRFTW